MLWKLKTCVLDPTEDWFFAWSKNMSIVPFDLGQTHTLYIYYWIP